MIRNSFASLLTTAVIACSSFIALPTNASDTPKAIPLLEKGTFSPETLRGLGFGRDHCWELIYGEKCTVK